MNPIPEHCFYISDPADLKFFQRSVHKRIYFGNEFCEFLLPDITQLKNMLEFSRRVNAPMTLLTPACSEKALARMRLLLRELPPQTEVVFNDWGTLEAAIEADMTPVHGRLLCHAKKDPRLGQTHAGMPHARTHNLQTAYQKMLLEKGVRRAELDNVFQGLDLQAVHGMSFSLHYPFVPCTVTRKCYYANTAMGNLKFRTITDCPVCCRGENIPIHTTGATLMMKGNAQYYANTSLSVNCEPPCIDRYVFTPVFPNHNFTEKAPLYLDWNRLFEIHGEETIWGDAPDRFLASLIEQNRPVFGNPPLSVLDLGCGQGRHAALFPNDIYWGLDISARAVESAASARKGTFIQGDILDSQVRELFGVSFHMVIDYGCFHAIPPAQRRRYFENVRALMAPGGRLLLCAWESSDAQTPVCYVKDQLPEWGVLPDTIIADAAGLFKLTGHRSIPCTNRSMLYAVLETA